MFDLTNDEPTLVVKYRLICENEVHRHWARFAWAFGLLCSSQINGYMADRFGRRSQICLCSVVLLVFGNFCLNFGRLSHAKKNTSE